MEFYKNKIMHMKNITIDFSKVINITSNIALILVSFFPSGSCVIEADFNQNYGLRVSIIVTPSRRVLPPFQKQDRPNLPQHKDS